MKTRRIARGAWVLASVIAVLAVVAVDVSAQEVVGSTEELSFDRPEAWAMKYFASATMLTGLGPPEARDPWSVEVGLEVGWLPHLDEDQRRVGFNGTKVEDLNRLPALVRPRVRIGLPARLTLDLSWVPPVELEGLEANLVAVGLERPLVERERWTLGLRVIGQLGELEGDLTCSEEDASHPPGSPENEFGCEAPSQDTIQLDYVGAAVTGGVDLSTSGTGTLHYAVAASYLDLETQVDALTYGYRDRNRLLASGWTYWATVGVSWQPWQRTGIAAEVFYSPLTVRRSPTASQENDGLLNVRVMLDYRLR